MLVRKASGRVDGFVIEGPTAGGHNAPPRGALRLNERGEPIYGERDVVDLAAVRDLGLPFWLAGGTGSPAALRAALDAGATGIQVGTLFAFAEESGLAAEYKRSVLLHAAQGAVEVHTDPEASPTGYPFKVVRWPGDPQQASPPRERVCDLGYLRTPYQRPDGRLGYRCSAEPVQAYVDKGGRLEETVGRRCLCNGLMANIGHAQVRADGRVEPPLLTSGDDLVSIDGFLRGRTLLHGGRGARLSPGRRVRTGRGDGRSRGAADRGHEFRGTHSELPRCNDRVAGGSKTKGPKTTKPDRAKRGRAIELPVGHASDADAHLNVGLRERATDAGRVVVAVPHRVILEKELAGERRVGVERYRRGAVELRVLQPADGGRGKLAVPTKQLDRLLARGVGVLAGMGGVDVVDGVPGHPGDRLPLGQTEGELDLERIHRGDMVDDHADRAAVARQARAPFGVGE